MMAVLALTGAAEVTEGCSWAQQYGYAPADPATAARYNAAVRAGNERGFFEARNARVDFLNAITSGEAARPTNGTHPRGWPAIGSDVSTQHVGERASPHDNESLHFDDARVVSLLDRPLQTVQVFVVRDQGQVSTRYMSAEDREREYASMERLDITASGRRLSEDELELLVPIPAEDDARHVRRLETDMEVATSANGPRDVRAAAQLLRMAPQRVLGRFRQEIPMRVYNYPDIAIMDFRVDGNQVMHRERTQQATGMYFTNVRYTYENGQMTLHFHLMMYVADVPENVVRRVDAH